MCALRYTEQIETRYDITDDQEETYILTRDEEIAEFLIDQLRTTQRKYFRVVDFWTLKGIAERFALPPIDEKAISGAVRGVLKIVDNLVECGKIVYREINGQKCYRKRFKTEKI